MGKSRLEYGHVTFPLSLTEKEKEQYADFCKSKGQTTSGRIKELIREDMGASVLSPFREKYQLDILESAKDNRAMVLIKSRQMWISEILLSIALDGMLTKKRKDKAYSCTFISCNQEGAKMHMKRFIKLCRDNGIPINEHSNRPNRVLLMNDAYIDFEIRMANGIANDMVIFDEMAFNKNIDKEELNLLLVSGSRVIVSSTPKKGSLFNKLAKEAALGKGDYACVIAHWAMNSFFQKDVVAVADSSPDGFIRFNIEHGEIKRRMNSPQLYAEEMDCALF